MEAQVKLKKFSLARQNARRARRQPVASFGGPEVGGGSFEKAEGFIGVRKRDESVEISC